MTLNDDINAVLGVGQGAKFTLESEEPMTDLLAKLEGLRREHGYFAVADGYFATCLETGTGCHCGADAANARLDEAIAQVRELIDERDLLRNAAQDETAFHDFECSCKLCTALSDFPAALAKAKGE